jgi:hypothetical protein
MNSRVFIFRCVLYCGLVLGVLVATNYWIDLYGLFWRSGKNGISIYSDERTSKYLLSYNYVPRNFDALMLGPSLSANINTKEIQNYKIYNLSMMGANITEQSAVAMKVLEKSNPKFVIICLHPYLTADHGMKTGMINPKEFYGALGSMSLYKVYVLKLIREFELMPVKYPKNQFNDYGYNFYNDLLSKVPVVDRIQEELEKNDAVKTVIDTIAQKEFNILINKLSEKNIIIITYFHPLPRPIFNRYQNQINKYQETIESELNGRSSVIDFNDSTYQFFTQDLSNYIDHGHLSEKGQRYLLQEIIKKSRLDDSGL